MALVNIAAIRQKCLQMLKKVDLGEGVGLYSYKRNRRIVIFKRMDSLFHLYEDGYITAEKDVETGMLGKELDKAIKREFPRSRKVRLYRLNNEDASQDFKKI